MAPEASRNDSIDHEQEQQPALGGGKSASEYEAGTVNLDVSGTVGPDYMGQQTTDVRGHRYDRPGVQARLDSEDPRQRRQDTGSELPVLLSSSMSTDPIEGTQGSFTIIEEGWCPRCGYDRLRTTVQTMAGEHRSQCQACDAIIEPHGQNQFRMPQTQSDRNDMIREHSEHLGDCGLGEVYKKTDRAIEVIRNNGHGSLYIPAHDLEDFIEVCFDEGMLDPAKLIGMFDYDTVKEMSSGTLKPDETDLTTFDWFRLAMAITPRTVGLTPRDTVDPLTNLDDDVVSNLAGWLWGDSA